MGTVQTGRGRRAGGIRRWKRRNVLGIRVTHAVTVCRATWPELHFWWRATEGWGIGEVLGRVARARGGSNPNDGAYPGAVTARLLSGLEHQRVNRDIVVPAMLAFV